MNTTKEIFEEIDKNVEYYGDLSIDVIKDDISTIFDLCNFYLDDDVNSVAFTGWVQKTDIRLRVDFNINLISDKDYIDSLVHFLELNNYDYDRSDSDDKTTFDIELFVNDYHFSDDMNSIIKEIKKQSITEKFKENYSKLDMINKQMLICYLVDKVISIKELDEVKNIMKDDIDEYQKIINMEFDEFRNEYPNFYNFCEKHGNAKVYTIDVKFYENEEDEVVIIPDNYF